MNMARRILFWNASTTSIWALTFLLAAAPFQSSCASKSVGELPLLQETVAAQCPAGAIKECLVWGGNKFRKRYEYCGCWEYRR